MGIYLKRKIPNPFIVVSFILIFCFFFYFRILVGAPEAQTTQYNVTKGGSVYRCTTSDDQCQEVPFDRNGKLESMSKTLRISRKWLKNINYLVGLIYGLLYYYNQKETPRGVICGNNLIGKSGNKWKCDSCCWFH